MSIFLLITVLAAAWQSGCWTTLALQGKKGAGYAVALMLGAIFSGIVLIGYVASNQH